MIHKYTDEELHRVIKNLCKIALHENVSYEEREDCIIAARIVKAQAAKPGDITEID